MKRTLIIAYDFPPAGGGGVQRTTKFVKYLNGTSWSPIVLTVKNPLYLLRDETFCQEIPHTVEIIRANEWLPNNLLLSLRERLRHAPERITMDQGVTEKQEQKKPLLKRFLRQLAMKVSKWVMPDLHVAWTLPALVTAYRFIRSQHVEVIFATAPPFSVLLIAYLLNKLTGIPYVVDFRDAWTLNPLRIGTFKTRLESFMERRILAEASHVIFATEIMQSDYEQHYPALVHKFSTITNGYDEADFANLLPKVLLGIAIVYMGRVTQKLRLDNFLLAMKNLFEQQPMFAAMTKLYFVGDVYLTQKEEVALHGLQDITTYVGYLPHRQALEYALGADVLLLLGSGDLAEMTGKIFEYLRAGRPIFAVVPQQSAAARLILQTGHGQVAQIDDIEEIQTKLTELLLAIQGDKQKQLNLNDHVKLFERENQARQLASVFDHLYGR